MSTTEDQQPPADPSSARLANALEQGDDAACDEVTASTEADYLCMRIGTRLFALLVENVAEVVTPSQVTPVPHTPQYVPGVINRHGRVTAVLDLAAYIGEAVEGTPSRIAVLASGELEAGVPVSEVVGIHPFTRDDVEPPLPDMQQLGGFVVGHLVWDSQVFVVLDAAKLLGDARHTQSGAERAAVTG